jgi:adenylate cyclase
VNHLPFLRQVLRAAWNMVSRWPRSVADLKQKWGDLENLVLSWSAMTSRQLGVRAMLIIGIGASVYAVFLYVADRIAPTSTSAAHDTILKARWSSPAPARDVIIVDIDERSLAAMAPEHGRWPWPRSVLADGLQRLSDSGARAVLFNVMLSDPDKNNPDADAAMEATAAMLPNVVYPVIRLNPENDSRSQLSVADFLARTGDPSVGMTGTVAVLLPMFETMWPRLGMANQKPDEDGIVRRYPVLWTDASITMPSIVARAALIAGISYQNSQITLNWRNKKGRYERVSFSDLMTAKHDDASLQRFKGAMVVLGVSAPGVGQTKGTAVTSVEDDNEILATALDDLTNNTHLRVIPAWAVLVLELGAVWALVWVGSGRKLSPILNVAFLAFQSGAASITMLSASYTHYLIDLSSTMAFGAGVFAAIKLVQSLDSGWSRARPGYRRAAPEEDSGGVVLLGYRDSQVSVVEAGDLQRFLEARVGLSGVIRVDDLFGGESFARKVCEDFSCQLVRVEGSSMPGLLAAIRALPLFERLDVREVPMLIKWNPEQDEFRSVMAPTLLRQCADIMER